MPLAAATLWQAAAGGKAGVAARAGGEGSGAVAGQQRPANCIHTVARRRQPAARPPGSAVGGADKSTRPACPPVRGQRARLA
eukprot:8626995-Alexandrium_andersonii.AAC.1